MAKGRVTVRGKTVKRGQGKKVDFTSSSTSPASPSPRSRPRTTPTAWATACSRPPSTMPKSSTCPLPTVQTVDVNDDRTGAAAPVEREIPLDRFPSLAELWQRFRAAKGLHPGPGGVATW